MQLQHEVGAAHEQMQSCSDARACSNSDKTISWSSTATCFWTPPPTPPRHQGSSTEAATAIFLAKMPHLGVELDIWQEEVHCVEDFPGALPDAVEAKPARGHLALVTARPRHSLPLRVRLQTTSSSGYLNSDAYSHAALLSWQLQGMNASVQAMAQAGPDKT